MRYIIFGDSLADPDFPYDVDDVDWRWFKLLDYPYINYAVGGTGVWFSIEKMFEYLESDDYRETDRIIFIKSHWNRAIKFTNNRFATSQWKMNHNRVDNPETKWDKYHAKNFAAHKYMTDNIISKKLVNNVVELLTAYLKQLPNETLLLPSFQPHEGELGHDDFDPSIFSLVTASRQEFTDISEMKKTLKETKDKRHNHFVPENHQVVANLIMKYFETKDMSVFDLNAFKQYFLTKENYFDKIWSTE